jgi:ATP-dependent HslUV protease subunit HslV
MSIIAAVRKAGKIVIGADTQVSIGTHIERASNMVACEKLVKFGESYIGVAGVFIYTNIFEDYLDKALNKDLNTKKEVFSFFLTLRNDLKEKYSLVSEGKESFSDIDASFIVANKNGIFSVAGNLTVIEYKSFVAIGSGMKYAYGAMHAVYDSLAADKICHAGVAAACAFDDGCSVPIRIVRIK